MPVPRGERERVVFDANARRLVAERRRLLADEADAWEIELAVHDASPARSSWKAANELRQRRAQIDLRGELLGARAEDAREHVHECRDRQEPLVPARRPARRPPIEEAACGFARAQRQAADSVPAEVDDAFRDFETIARLELRAHRRAPSMPIRILCSVAKSRTH